MKSWLMSCEEYTMREWNGSNVMEEFAKTAAESGLITTNLKPEKKDFVGNPSKETPVKDHRRYEPTEEYELKVEPTDVVGKAHPQEAWMAEKSTPMSSMGKGSLVENIKEQQEKDIEVATRMPSGALPGVHASLMNELIKLATELDDAGKHKEAIRVDRAIERLKANGKRTARRVNVRSNSNAKAPSIEGSPQAGESS